MKKNYIKPTAQSFTVKFEGCIAASEIIGTGGDFGDGSGFQTTRRRMWDEEEEEQ